MHIDCLLLPNRLTTQFGCICRILALDTFVLVATEHRLYHKAEVASCVQTCLVQVNEPSLAIHYLGLT